MPVVNARAIRSFLAGLIVRFAGFAVIFSLFGMFAQMVTVAYPILAPSTLTPLGADLKTSAYGGKLEEDPIDSTRNVSLSVAGDWSLEGVVGESWFWVNSLTGFRVENTDLPKVWSAATAVGSNRGVAIAASDGVISHHHFLASTREGDAPWSKLVEKIEWELPVIKAAGHPRLAVLALLSEPSNLTIIDFRNPQVQLTYALSDKPSGLFWESPSLLRIITGERSELFEFATTDIGGAWSRLIKPVHYEGYTAPTFLWLPLPSSEAAEPKYSIAPLLFGTLKAAFLALLVGAPLSLGAAIYVGFFMSPVQRGRIRPVIDMLTAFPTVVLGAIGLFWIAPVFETVLTGLIGIAILFPFFIILGVFAMRSAGLRLVRLDALDDWPLKLLPVVATAIVLSAWAGIAASGFLPGGSLVQYLEGQGITLAYFNSLLVGLVLGVAITPTIFSVAEEAIHSVPKNLASGALALGSTPWQSYRDIVLPLALPGMIAAIMIGFGRAAGETMILLMLSGNTSIIDVTVFEGLRSVSASLALELPEAPRDSSHYYVLFVMGLLLFGITFVVNTLAEIIKDSVKAKTQGV